MNSFILDRVIDEIEEEIIRLTECQVTSFAGNKTEQEKKQRVK